MTHGSLFSGIGGFEYAAQAMGWDNVFHCEINSFGQQVLKHHYPKSISYDDITKTDFSIHAGQIDIITGGFPCQPYSQAGKRLGKEDDRHLWPEMLRVIRQVQPRWVVGENVFGLINWNDGLVFDEVQADLEAEGYEVQPYVLPAVAVNAPHRRDRVWFVAYADKWGRRERVKFKHNNSRKRQVCKNITDDRNKIWSKSWNGSSDRITSDTSSIGCDNRGDNGQERHISENKRTAEKSQSEWNRRKCGISETCKTTPNSDSNGLNQRNSNDEVKSSQRRQHAQRDVESSDIIERTTGNWSDFPTQSPVRLRDDGFSRILVRYLTTEVINAISQTSQENRIKDVQEVWDSIQSPKIWEQIRGLYALESKDVLLQTMQLYSGAIQGQDKLSPFSEDFSKDIVRELQKHGEFRRSPHGRELEKQRSEQYPNFVPQLPHEVALASKAFEKAMLRFDSWHRQESVKAYGNAIVPQVAIQIFKAIEQYEQLQATQQA
jgi:DNA (cytosine-5)-methyltransferase 1